MYPPRHSSLGSGFPTKENSLIGVVRRRDCDQERLFSGSVVELAIGLMLSSGEVTLFRLIFSVKV